MHASPLGYCSGYESLLPSSYVHMYWLRRFATPPLYCSSTSAQSYILRLAYISKRWDSSKIIERSFAWLERCKTQRMNQNSQGSIPTPHKVSMSKLRDRADPTEWRIKMLIMLVLSHRNRRRRCSTRLVDYSSQDHYEHAQSEDLGNCPEAGTLLT